VISLLLLASAHAACPDPTTALDAAEAAVVAGDLKRAEGANLDAMAAFGCGPAADPSMLARMWNAQGAALLIAGDSVSAHIAFRAAHRVAPGVWDARYGADMAAAAKLAAAEATADGQLAWTGGPDDAQAFIDGQPATQPATVAGGLHVFQAAQGGATWFASNTYVPPGDLNTLELPFPFSSSVAENTEPKRRFPTLLVAGAAGLALGGASVAGAVIQTGTMEDATETDTLDTAFRRQQVFGTAAWPLIGLGATGVVLHFVL
jgi:hypothetical protein